MVIHKTTLALDGAVPFSKIKMRQTDSGRALEASLTFGGVAFAIPAGAIIELNAKNPRGQVVTRTEGITFVGSTITAAITPNVLAVNGDVTCEFVITAQSGEQVGTVNFIIQVWGAVLTTEEIANLPDYEAVQSARAATAAARDVALSSAEAAASSEQSAAEALEQMEDIEHNPVRVGENENYWHWDSNNEAWVDSGVHAGAGDMLAADYDPTGEVAGAGGIPSYAIKKVIEARNVNIDDLTSWADVGFYACDTTFTQGTFPPGMPTGSFFLEVVPRGGGNVTMQKMICGTGILGFNWEQYRSYSAGSQAWGPWFSGTSSDSNANGSWVKWPDGTMICEKLVVYTGPANTAAGPVYSVTVPDGPWPQTFVGPVPTPDVKLRQISGGYQFIAGFSHRPSLTHTGLYVFHTPVSYPSMTVELTFTAFGRWK